MEQQNTQEYIVTSPEMMVEVVDGVLAEIVSHADCSVVGLSGELGAGKTTFMRTFLSRAGISNTASSPTFVVRKSYPVPADSSVFERFSKVSHVDAYRLDKAEDAIATGIVADADTGDTLLFVEWPERLGGVLEQHPAYLGTLRFEHISETSRRVVLEIK
jgi:tRNA threonylcarbamoyl adenosine modification protein YjeE